MEDDNPFFSSIDGVLFDKHQTVLICYPANHLGYRYTVPKTVKRIEDFAFSRADKLQTIELNEGLVEVGTCGFEGCNGLSELKFPSTLQGLGHVALQGCGKLRSIHIPANLQYINFPALPSNLETITVSPDNPVFTVVDNVLYSKDMTTLFRVPANYNAREFTVLPSVSRIESSAFSSCNYLQKIFIPDTVKSIGDFAFAYLEENVHIVLPDYLYSVNNRSFSLCNAVFESFSRCETV